MRRAISSSSTYVGCPTTICIRNRSRCASGNAYTPSDSIGFWVARTRNGVGRGAGLPGDRHVALGHDLEQRGLHLGRCPVDLVGEHEVREDRAPLDVEVFARRAPDPRADDVGRDEVGSELQAGERAADDLGERRNRQRLRQTRYALDEAVAAGEEADHRPFDHPVLADDHLLHLEQRLFQPVGVVLVVRRGGFGRRRTEIGTAHAQSSFGRSGPGTRVMMPTDPENHMRTPAQVPESRPRDPDRGAPADALSRPHPLRTTGPPRSGSTGFAGRVLRTGHCVLYEPPTLARRATYPRLRGDLR